MGLVMGLIDTSCIKQEQGCTAGLWNGNEYTVPLVMDASWQPGSDLGPSTDKDQEGPENLQLKPVGKLLS